MIDEDPAFGRMTAGDSGGMTVGGSGGMTAEGSAGMTAEDSDGMGGSDGMTVGDFSGMAALDRGRVAGMERMEVTGIKVWAHHGVFDHERRDGQPFIIDVAWWQDMARASETDMLSCAIDYAEVSQAVVALVRSSPANLIETVADRLRRALLARFPMDAVKITVHKPQAPLQIEFADVRVTTVGVRETPPRRVVFSLGSNIEPRLDYLQFAASGLASTPGIDQARVSPVYETKALGDVPQADFLNAVLVARSSLPAVELLRRGQRLESLAHRTREVDHGPRTLDIDLIVVGDEVLAGEELTLPHPRAGAREFVLRPWHDVDPEARLETVCVRDLLEMASDQGVRLFRSTLFVP